MSGESPGSIAPAAAPHVSTHVRAFDLRAWRPLSLLGSHRCQVPPLGSCASVSVTTRRQPHDGPPAAQEQARSNSQHGASPPQNGQRGRLARCRPTVLPAMPGHKRHSSPGRLDAHPLLHDGTCPRRPCPPHPPVMLVTIAAGPEPALLLADRTGSRRRQVRALSFSPAMPPRAIRDGQRRWPADSHSHSKRAAALAARR
jgi:hypothetical protein